MYIKIYICISAYTNIYECIDRYIDTDIIYIYIIYIVYIYIYIYISSHKYVTTDRVLKSHRSKMGITLRPLLGLLSTRWLFGSLVPAIYNRASCPQVHELPQSHYGDKITGRAHSFS